MAVLANDTSEGIRVTGGRLFATQVRISNVVTGISCRGGEVFLVNYDCENLTNGVSIDANHSGIQWIGGRINDYTIGLQITNGCQSIVLQGVTAVGTGATDSFVKRTAGTVNRATVMGNTVAVTANGITWALASIPTLGLTIMGNTFNVTTPFSGFSRSDPRVNSKGNIGPSGLMSETNLVP
jgi:hypothetical protein